MFANTSSNKPPMNKSFLDRSIANYIQGSSLTNIDRSRQEERGYKSRRKIQQIKNNQSKELLYQEQNKYNIRDKIEELYQTCTRKNATLYKVPIKGGQQGFKQLSEMQKIYLCSCYWILNQQPVLKEYLQQEIQKLPTAQDQLDSIRLQNGQLKFDKMNFSLVYSRGDQVPRIQQKTYSLNRIQSADFQKSIMMISINGMSYRFNSIILQIDSTENRVAVRTQNYVYIIGNGKMNSWKIQSSYIKWGCRGLYILENDGRIALIQRQKSYIPKINTYELLRNNFGTWHKNDFLVACSNQMVLVTINKQFINLRILDGSETKLNMNFNLDDNILYSDGYSINNSLILSIVTGIDDQVCWINEYEFVLL